MIPGDPNVAIVEQVAVALGDLRDDIMPGLITFDELHGHGLATVTQRMSALVAKAQP